MVFNYQVALWMFGEFPSFWVGTMINVMLALAVAAPSAPGFIGTYQFGCVVALTYIYGVGLPTSQRICDELGLDRNTKVSSLTEDEVNQIRHYVDEHLTIEGDLRRDVQNDIKRKIEIGSLQGVRHRKGLPVRGQRTHTNARTRKGPKRTVANKKKATK